VEAPGPTSCPDRVSITIDVNDHPLSILAASSDPGGKDRDHISVGAEGKGQRVTETPRRFIVTLLVAG